MGTTEPRHGSSRMKTPEVSIGLPVYNGARYLGAALDSILEQSFGDFEIVICDNASTDATAAIARGYARDDPRVRVFRNETNLGAVPNYNRTFALARGRFFKWAAHDDTIEPAYLERTVAALRGDPELVLSHSGIRAIDERGRELRRYSTGLAGAHDADVAKRFAALVLVPHRCMEIFALVRADALRRTDLQLPYHGCDRALLAELALLGRFHHVEEPLFNNREHDLQYVRSVPAEERARWADARQAGRVGVPTWRLYRQVGRAVGRHVADPAGRRRCRRVLARWWFHDWHAARVGVEALSALSPRIHRVAARVRRRLDASAVTPPPPARRAASVEPRRESSAPGVLEGESHAG